MSCPARSSGRGGTSDFGQASNRPLTDEDGPYIELMCGAYTDNQPDFAWIMPGEEKRFTQVFMPYKQIGGAKNANREVVVNLQVHGTEAAIGIYVAGPRTVRVELLLRSEPVYTRTLDLTPESALVETVTALQSNALLRAGGQGLHNILVEQDLTLRVWGVDGDGEQRLIEYTPLPDSRPEIPPPATPARPPTEIRPTRSCSSTGCISNSTATPRIRRNPTTRRRCAATRTTAAATMRWGCCSCGGGISRGRTLFPRRHPQPDTAQSEPL